MSQIDTWQDALGVCVLLAGILLFVFGWIAHWLALGDEQFRFENPLETELAAKSEVERILEDMGLRRPLPEVVKAERQCWPATNDHIGDIMRANGASEKDIADTLKGTRI